MLDLLWPEAPLVALAAKAAWDAAALWRIARRDPDEWQADRILAWARTSPAPCAKLGHEYTVYGCAWDCDDILVFPGFKTGTGGGFIEYGESPYGFYVARHDKRFRFAPLAPRPNSSPGWYGLWLYDRTVPRESWQEVPDADKALDHDGVDLYLLSHGKKPPSAPPKGANRTGTPALNAQPRRAGDAPAQRRRQAPRYDTPLRAKAPSYPRGQR